MSISVESTEGPLKLHSIYSQKSGDVALGELREGIWFGDINDYQESDREQWKQNFRSFGNRLVLNRLGKFHEFPTRYPIGNQYGHPTSIGVIAMQTKDVARLSALCTEVGGEHHVVSGLTDHRPVVCEFNIRHKEAKPEVKKSKWNMRKVDKDPLLKDVFKHKLKQALSLVPNGEGQEAADESLQFIAATITETAEEVVGRVKCKAPKRWWSTCVHHAHSERTAAYKKINSLREGTAPHAFMFKTPKAKNKSYKIAVAKSKKTAMKEQIKSGPKGVQRAMSKASGSSSRDLSRYM